MAQERSNSNSRGFSLVEVLVAMGILTAVSLGIAQLFAATGRANLMARGNTSTTAMAEQKMEQLRSLTWGFDTVGMGLPVSDTSSNIAVFPMANNGSGLNPSPPNALIENTPGFVDYLDENGAWVATGLTPPPTAQYIRRWAIEPLPTNPNNTLVLQVLVTPVVNEAGRENVGTRRARGQGEALLTTVKTRKAS